VYQLISVNKWFYRTKYDVAGTGQGSRLMLLGIIEHCYCCTGIIRLGHNGGVVE